jgi:hypothetical protein
MTEPKSPELLRSDAEAYHELQKLIGQKLLDALLKDIPKPQPASDQ